MRVTAKFLWQAIDVRKAKPTPVRFSEEQEAFVKEVAASSRGVMKEVDVIRLALDALKDYWERHGKRALLPLRFDETFVVYQIVLPASPKEKVIVGTKMPDPVQKKAGAQ